MKTILSLMVALIVTTGSYAAVVAGDSVKAKPSDVSYYELHDNTASSSDTFTAGECQAYGPYSVTNATNQPMYKGFQLSAKAITGTSPTMSFGYQLIPTGKISDTLSMWTEVDTLDGIGANNYVDLSSKAGAAIVFRVNNYDGTACQIPNYLRVMFKKNMSMELNR